MEDRDSLLIGFLNRSLNEQQQLETLAWINESAVNREYFESLKSVYLTGKSVLLSEHSGAAEEWAILRKKIHSKGRVVPLIQRLRKIAAILLIMVTASAAIVYLMEQRAEMRPATYSRTVVLSTGDIRKMVLPDGSRVWLNSSHSTP